MEKFDLTQLFSAMDILVLMRHPKDQYRIVGLEPDWFSEFQSFVMPSETKDEEFSPFLNDFLNGLEDFWITATPAFDRRKSGWWSKIDRVDRTRYFQATALRFNKFGFLLIEHATSEDDLFKSLKQYKQALLELDKLKLAYQECHLELGHFKELTFTDSLTGLPNQTGFYDKARKLCDQMKSNKTSLLILAIGLNGLFMINDKFGVAEGSMAIITLSGLLEKFFPPSDVISRFGGGEFVVLAQETPLNNMDTIERRLNDYVAEYNRTSPKTYFITTSMGLVKADPNPMHLEELIKVAEQKMNEEKQIKADPGKIFKK